MKLSVPLTSEEKEKFSDLLVIRSVLKSKKRREYKIINEILDKRDSTTSAQDIIRQNMEKIIKDIDISNLYTSYPREALYLYSNLSDDSMKLDEKELNYRLMDPRLYENNNMSIQEKNKLLISLADNGVIAQKTGQDLSLSMPDLITQAMSKTNEFMAIAEEKNLTTPEQMLDLTSTWLRESLGLDGIIDFESIKKDISGFISEHGDKDEITPDMKDTFTKMVKKSFNVPPEMKTIFENIMSKVDNSDIFDFNKNVD